MPGASDPDYTITITTDGTAEYRLTFGSLLRAGAVYETPTLDTETAGRVVGGTTTLTDGSHDWRADGPISLFNNGPSPIGVSINGSETFIVQPSGSIDTSCPTERKRLTALGAVGGALLTGVGGTLLDARN